MSQVRIDDIMVKQVITAQQHHSVDHLRKMMQNNNIHAIPIVDSENVPIGIVSSIDLAKELKGSTPASQIMTRDIYRIPRYNGVHLAARLMRNHKIHHVLVTHEQELVGIISSFDLLALVEEHRFIMKNGKKDDNKKD